MERFEKTYSQRISGLTEIWVDTVTGVNYLFHAVASFNGGGLTPLLDKNGKPVINKVD